MLANSFMRTGQIIHEDNEMINHFKIFGCDFSGMRQFDKSISLFEFKIPNSLIKVSSLPCFSCSWFAMPKELYTVSHQVNAYQKINPLQKITPSFLLTTLHRNEQVAINDLFLCQTRSTVQLR